MFLLSLDMLAPQLKKTYLVYEYLLLLLLYSSLTVGCEDREFSILKEKTKQQISLDVEHQEFSTLCKKKPQHDLPYSRLQ